MISAPRTPRIPLDTSHLRLFQGHDQQLDLLPDARVPLPRLSAALPIQPTTPPVEAPRPDPPADRLYLLRDVYEADLLPQLVAGKRKRCTIREYEAAIEFWEAYWIERRDTDTASVSQPAADAITSKDLSIWRDWLLANQDVTNRMINKHLGAVIAILNAADQQIVQRPPKLKPLEHTPETYIITIPLEHISAFYRSCYVATWPKLEHISAPDIWRASIVWYYNYGFRTEELMSFKLDLPGLKWRQICLAPESPAINGHAVNEHGWFHYVPEKQKRKKRLSLVLPMTPITLAHLKLIMPPDVQATAPLIPQSMADADVFPIPNCARDFYHTWDKIRSTANVRPKKNLETGFQPEYLIKHFRSTCETAHNDNFGDSKDPDDRGLTIGEFITGHAARTVSEKSYASKEKAILRSVTTLPQPEAFYDIFSRDSTRQKRLF